MESPSSFNENDGDFMDGASVKFVFGGRLVLIKRVVANGRRSLSWGELSSDEIY